MRRCRVDKGRPKWEKHILKWGLGLTKKIIAHYGSGPSPTGDGHPGREEGLGERKGEKTSALSLCGQQVEVF